MNETKTEFLKGIYDRLWSVGMMLDYFIVNTDFNEIEDGDEALHDLQEALSMVDEPSMLIANVLENYFNVEV